MKSKMAIRSFLALALLFSVQAVQAESEAVFELRTYTTNEGKLDDLQERFINHTLGYFEKHGMVNIGYWVPTDPEKSKNTLIYIVKHQSLEAAAKNWAAFGQDPGWQKAYAESRVDGPIVKHIDSVFMTATEYSKIQ